MTLVDAMNELEALGSEDLRRRNAKNGAGENQFGVKMGDLRTLANKIKTNPDLAKELWATGNVDARLLASLLVRPKKLSVEEVDRMVRESRFPQLADWVNSYVVKQHPQKEQLRERWMVDSDEWALRAGWSLTAERIAKDAAGLDLAELLDRIEAEMTAAPANAQWTMNGCLAAIGIHHQEYRDRALAIGESLGIYRDYPVSKGCTSPFAPIWIAEMVRRQGT